MKRAALVLLALAALAASACSARDAGQKAILDRCLAGGEDEKVCDCQAQASAEKLDQELFDLVVLGAKGEEAEAAVRAEELTPELQGKFSALIPEIKQECESAAALSAS
jgi:hypothetical protein